MDLNHRPAGYEPAGHSWLPHLAMENDNHWDLEAIYKSLDEKAFYRTPAQNIS